MTNQKDAFLAGEGDAWFERNHAAVAEHCNGATDPVVEEVCKLSELSGAPRRGMRVLEVGCGEGWRLQWLKDNHGFEVYGIEPSARAVAAARARGVAAQQGTADELPFAAGYFDVLIFGFCLYLCDREDLFTVAREADRVLVPAAWLVIHDFYSPTPARREYHHRPGLFSYKMDYRTLFSWHPAYTCFSHRLRHHSSGSYTDYPDQWVATSVLRKQGIHGR